MHACCCIGCLLETSSSLHCTLLNCLSTVAALNGCRHLKGAAVTVTCLDCCCQEPQWLQVELYTGLPALRTLMWMPTAMYSEPWPALGSQRASCCCLQSVADLLLSPKSHLAVYRSYSKRPLCCNTHSQRAALQEMAPGPDGC